MPRLTNADVQNAIHLTEDLECTPDEVAQIMRLPLELVLHGLCRPCQCGRDGCLVVRKDGETCGHYRERKTSGRNECKRRAGTDVLREESAEELGVRYPILARKWRAHIGAVKLAALAGCSRRDVDRYRKLRADDPPEPVAEPEPVDDFGDPLLFALQRRHPPHEDASVAHEYPPMRRGVRRLEAVA